MRKSKRIVLTVALLMLVLGVSMFAVACKDTRPQDTNGKPEYTLTFKSGGGVPLFRKSERRRVQP